MTANCFQKKLQLRESNVGNTFDLYQIFDGVNQFFALFASPFQVRSTSSVISLLIKILLECWMMTLTLVPTTMNKAEYSVVETLMFRQGMPKTAPLASYLSDAGTKPRPTALNKFPLQLHDMLDDAQKLRFQDIVSWHPDGKSFVIHDPHSMTIVLEKYFNQTKYKSFLRQLQNYGFSRQLRGLQKGRCSHPLLIRGRKSLCMKMKRVKHAAASIINTDVAPSLPASRLLECKPRNLIEWKRFKRSMKNSRLVLYWCFLSIVSLRIDQGIKSMMHTRRQESKRRSLAFYTEARCMKKAALFKIY